MTNDIKKNCSINFKLALVFLFFLLLVILPAASLPGTGSPSGKVEKVEVKKVISMTKTAYRSYLENNPPLDRLYCTGDICVFLVNTRELSRLQNSPNLEYQRRDNVFPKDGCPLNNIESSANGDYHDYYETETGLYELENRFPGKAHVFSIGQSIEGREIFAIKISDNVLVDEGTDKGFTEPNVFIIGCHHAREWISVEIPLLFARYVLEQYPMNEEVKRIIEGSQIFIVPILNPDGLEFSINSYRFWRKNRRYNGNLCWGVDLNRNYAFQWAYDDFGSNSYFYSDTYRGSGPFSEPETAALRDLASAHQPLGSLSFHNFAQTILFPWGYTSEPAPDDLIMRNLAKEMSRLMAPVNGREYSYGSGADELYLTNGDSDDWLYSTYGTLAFTIELPPTEFFMGGFFTTQEEIQRTFAETLPAMLYFINYFIDSNAGEKDEIKENFKNINDLLPKKKSF